jgi:hypothetical protein
MCHSQDLKGRVFMLTAEIDKEKCEIASGCDCCYSELFFLTDKEFGLIARCIYNDTYYKGAYSIKQDKLTLTFKQMYVNEIVDEATFKVTHTVEKSGIDPTEFTITECNGNLKLESTIPGFEHGLSQPDKVEKELFKKLKTTEAWKLISK